MPAKQHSFIGSHYHPLPLRVLVQFSDQGSARTCDERLALSSSGAAYFLNTGTENGTSERSVPYSKSFSV